MLYQWAEKKNDEPWKNKQIKNKTLDSAFFLLSFDVDVAIDGTIDSLLLFLCYDRNGFFRYLNRQKGWSKS